MHISGSYYTVSSYSLTLIQCIVRPLNHINNCIVGPYRRKTKGHCYRKKATNICIRIFFNCLSDTFYQQFSTFQLCLR